MTIYYYDLFSGSSGTALTAHTADSGATWPNDSNHIHGSGIELDGGSWGPGGSGGIFSSGSYTAQIPSATMPSSANYEVRFTFKNLSNVSGNYAGVVFYVSSPFGTYTDQYGYIWVEGLGFGWEHNNSWTGFTGSFVPSLNTLYYVRIYVQTQNGFTTFRIYSSTDGVNFTAPSSYNTYSIATTSDAIAVGPVFQGTTTATTGAHIGQLYVQDPVFPSPTIQISNAYVTSSGGAIAVEFGTISGSTPINATSLITTTGMTVTQNGTSVGAIPTAWVPGYSVAMIMMPAGVTLKSTDTVLLTTPTTWAWCNTSTVAAQTNFPVSTSFAPVASGSYYTYNSCFGSTTLTKTLRPGYNFSLNYPSPGATYSIFANLRYRLDVNLVSGTTWTADGYPTKMVSTSITQNIFNWGYPNNLDSTGYPGQPGYYAITYDDNYIANSGSPTTLTLASGNSAQCTVTQITGCNNTGAGGIGQYYLFNVQPASGTTVTNLPLVLQWSNSAKTPYVSNLEIRGPGDFTVPSLTNTSWTFARNPMLLSSQSTSAFANGVGSMRFLGASEATNQSSVSEAWEQRGGMSDFSWVSGNFQSHAIQYQQINPLSSGTYPYIYGDSNTLPNGSTWTATATLASNITTAPSAGTMQTIAVSSTADNLFYGLTLTIDSETMKVYSVSGTSITVMRGAEGTTPATHTSGAAITLGTRIATGALSQYGAANTQIFVMQSVNPHMLKTGQQVTLSGTYPILTFSNGSTFNISNQKVYVWVTGPNTFWAYVQGTTSTVVTLSSTVNLTTPYSQYTTTYSAPDQGMPFAAQAYLVSLYANCVGHVAFPIPASPSYLYAMAQTLFTTWPVGQPLILEAGDEPWNGGQNQFYVLTMLGRINGGNGAGSNGYYWQYAEIAQAARTIFRGVWGTRASEIQLGYNVQTAGAASAPLSAALTAGCHIDTLLVNTYLNGPQDGNSFAAYASATIEQCVDMWIHWIYLGLSSSPGGNLANQLASWKSQLSTYATATGYTPTMSSYEGGYSFGNPITVAQEVSPTLAQTQMARDIQYDPVFAVAIWDMLALMQTSGIVVSDLNTYAFPANFANCWGAYQSYGQVPGVGDGSDGLANNRLYRATSGLTGPIDYTKPSSGTPAQINQDNNSVSVRMKAFKDWMRQTSGGNTPVVNTGTVSVAASPAVIMLGM